MFRVKGVLGVIVFLAMSLVLTACGSPSATSKSQTKSPSPSQTQSKEPYKIGYLTTLSGPVGFLGKDMLATVQMETDRINAAGGINGHPIELVPLDDGGNPSQAATGFNKLVLQDKVLMVTGTNLPIDEALIPLAQRYKIPYIYLTPMLPNVRSHQYNEVFDLSPNEFVEAAAWLDILKHDKYTNVAAIGENDGGLATTWLNELKKEAGAQGITVNILPDFVNITAVNLTPQVVKLKELCTATKSQAIVSSVWASQVPAMLQEMKQAGLNLPVILYYYGADNSILAAGGNILNGLEMPGVKVVAGAALPNSDPQKSVIVSFYNRYEAKFHQTPGAESSFAYDAIHIIANALKVSGPNSAKLRDALENTKNYVGVTGIYNMSPTDHEGLTKSCMAIYKIVNHKFVFLRDVE